MKKIIMSFLGVISILTFSLGFIYAWVINSENINPNITGKTESAYFESGDGTEDSPYIISNKTHIYNFAWLQYLGMFNHESSTTGYYETIYFKLKNDIDCDGLTIPAIGTTANPFVGVFDGGGFVISNINVTNRYSQLTLKPGSVEKLDNASIIGFFGVIGKYDNESGYNIVSTSDGKLITSVSNFYLENIRVNVTSGQILAGIIAGYVNANISNIGVEYSSFDFATQASALKSKISNYALIGDYNSDDGVDWSDKPGTSIGFGGSIDITSLSKRVTYIAANAGKGTDSTNTSYTYDSAIYNSHFYTTRSSTNPGYDWTVSGETQTIAFEEGTYLPLNIDLTTANVSNNNTNTNAYYDGKNAEPILNSNVGYIVGNSSTGNTSVRLTHKKADKSSSGIVNSIYTQQAGNDTTDMDEMFASKNYSLFYINSSGTSYRITDNDNLNLSYTKHNDNKIDSSNFSNYSNVKSQFIDSLKDSVTEEYFSSNGKIVLNGILLRKGNASSISFKDFSNVKINNITYDTYKMAEGGINYSLSQNGNLSLICGTFASSSSNHTFYDFYEIDRTTDSSSPSAKKIYKIYKNSSSGDVKYTYDSSSTVTDSGYELKFDLASLNSSAQLYANCAYYMEIPFKSGDYFITNIGVSASNSPYLLYLDVGANASTTGETDATISKIDFVYKVNNSIVKVNDDGYTASNVLYSIEGTTTLEVVIYYRRIQNDGVLYYYESIDGLTMTTIGSGSTSKASSNACESKES